MLQDLPNKDEDSSENEYEEIEDVPEKPIKIKDIRSNHKIKTLIKGANELMRAIGYTEHGLRHAGIVSNITRYIMASIGASQRDIELAQIAAFMHDIGNVVNRTAHPMIGGTIAFTLLNELGMPPNEISPIVGAIGNHEEPSGMPVSPMSAALILADKSDVHYSRVQNPFYDTYDIHDRVNYAVQKSRITVQPENKIVELTLEIDTKQATVMEYFEIFLSRMMLSRHAAKLIGYRFALNVNGVHMD